MKDTTLTNWRERVIQLGSLVGTDAKNPEENLIDYIDSLLKAQRLSTIEMVKGIFEEYKMELFKTQERPSLSELFIKLDEIIAKLEGIK